MRLIATPPVQCEPWPIADSIRALDGVCFLCPTNPEWAGRLDAAAIHRHGLPIGAATPEQIRLDIIGTAQLDAWDHAAAGDLVKVAFDPLEQFCLLRDHGIQAGDYPGGRADHEHA